MAVPMDGLKSTTAVPPDAPLDIPKQDLKRYPERQVLPLHWHTVLARLIAFGGALIIGSIGTWQMYLALGSGNLTILQWVLLVLFSLTFYWVAFSTSGALAGLIPALQRKEQLNPDGGKVAIVMPVYGEDQSMTASGLLAISKALAQTAIASRCEVFIISDTQNADAWLGETVAFQRLRSLSPLPVWYRRRKKNIGRKAGNVEQFITQWGNRYEYMLMLDADSLMDGKTIEKMVARMDAEPQLGLLQTMPRLIDGESLLARTVQFAGALYGTTVAQGVDAWQGNDGNYWGHNALIRTHAFAECCGLPVLKGRRPIGGHIMSHDFVEAALMRRGGWAVRMDADLTGSYEGLPPTITDLASRERRWAQGNLQHLGVIGAKGLYACNRVHFAVGIAGYVMSPVWMLMMTVGLMITAQALFTQPEYFPLTHQLFPNWPTFDSRLMLILFFTALSLLLLPKLMGWVSVMLSSKRRKAFGGALTVSKSVLLELLLSTLYAPMMMLIQTHHVVDILLGRDSGWQTQSRSGDVMAWRDALRLTLFYVIIGVLPLVVLLWLAPQQIIWLSPVLSGLLLAPWLARHSGNIYFGQKLLHQRWLVTPEELQLPAIMSDAAKYRQQFTDACTLTLAEVLQHRQYVDAHIASLDKTANSEDEEQQLLAVTAKAKIEAAENLPQAIRFLSAEEQLTVAGNTALLALMINTLVKSHPLYGD